MGRLAISSKHYADEFPNGLSLDDKIEIFGDRVLHWQLVPAQIMVEQIPHAGFAALHVLMNYFESIAKFRDGFTEDGQSKEYFKNGFIWVFPEIENLPEDFNISKLIDLIYYQVRCGLYHTGMTGLAITISADIEFPIQINPQGIIINPHKIFVPIVSHLHKYLEFIRDPKNLDQRIKFEKRFDWLSLPVTDKYKFYSEDGNFRS
jgi:hypothetical protein